MAGRRERLITTKSIEEFFDASLNTALDNQHIDGTRSHQRVGNFQCLFTGIGLGNEKIVKIHAELAGINRIKSMLCVDERANSTLFLCFGNRV